MCSVQMTNCLVGSFLPQTVGREPLLDDLRDVLQLHLPARVEVPELRGEPHPEGGLGAGGAGLHGGGQLLPRLLLQRLHLLHRADHAGHVKVSPGEKKSCAFKRL